MIDLEKKNEKYTRISSTVFIIVKKLTGFRFSEIVGERKCSLWPPKKGHNNAATISISIIPYKTFFSLKRDYSNTFKRISI